MNLTMRRAALVPLALLSGVGAVGAGVLLTAPNAFYQDIVFWIMFWAGLAGAWNLVGGYVGQFSLGHAAFFGIGAYTSTLLYLTFGLSPWLGALAGGSLAALVGLAIAVVCLRLRGPFFALATLALAELLHILALYWRSLTRGAEGLTLRFAPSFQALMFETKIGYGAVALGFLIIVTGVALVLERSRVGLLLQALREDEDAARSVGVRVLRWKVVAAGLSAFFTALGGTLYAQYLQVIEPETVFTWEVSVQLALIAIIGGTAAWQGPIVGSLFLTPLAIGLRAWLGGSYAGLHLVVYGPILILSVLFMPEGLVPRTTEWFGMRRIRRQARLPLAERRVP